MKGADQPATTAPVVLYHDGRPVKADLVYHAVDPYAVRMNIRNGKGVIPWQMDRDHVADGLRAPTGEGDVRIGPVDGDPSRTKITLSNRNGAATLTTDTWALADFLDRSYEQVPRGAENDYVDVDGELDELFAREDANDDGDAG